MFTPEDREKLRNAIVERARRDARISGGAITGSASVGREDRWSDIDLAFGVSAAAERDDVLKDYSEWIYQAADVVSHLDVPSGPWIYRVFVLASTLQVDLAFVSEENFVPRGPKFKLLFGTADEPPPSTIPDSNAIIGWAWLYALHVRSCLARGKLWQAEYMIAGMRNEVLKLVCLRNGLEIPEGRGYDLLPSAEKERLAGAFAARLSSAELARAFRVVSEAFLLEVRLRDEGLATRLEGLIERLVGSASRVRSE